MEDITPELLWGGEALRNYVVELTHEKDLTMGKFYQRAKRGIYGPLRKVGQTLTGTPGSVRAHLIGNGSSPAK